MSAGCRPRSNARETSRRRLTRQGRRCLGSRPAAAGLLQPHGGWCRRASRTTSFRRIDINPTAQALLNLFPLPTIAQNANGNNYTFQTVQDWPRNDQVLRIDWNVAPKTTAYGRVQYGL